MAERTPRNMSTREDELRPTTWQPPSFLPTPDVSKAPDYEFRWVRMSTNGEADASNLSAKLREGWEPVKASDHPEMRLPVEAIKDNRVEFGGLVLCKIPREIVNQRRTYYKDRNRDAILSVDQTLMRENDPRMPLFNERKTKVSFGSES